MLQPLFRKVAGIALLPWLTAASLVAASAGVSDVELGQPGLRMYDQRGRRVARWSPNVAGSVSSLVDGRDGRLVCFRQRFAACPDCRKIAERSGVAAEFRSLGSIRSITKLPDGGRLLLGSFDVGMAVCDIAMCCACDRTERRTLTGVSSWTTATTSQLLLQNRDCCFVGRFRQVNGVRRSGAALVSLNGGAMPLDWTPGVELSGRSYVYDGRDTLYVTTDDAPMGIVSGACQC